MIDVNSLSIQPYADSSITVCAICLLLTQPNLFYQFPIFLWINSFQIGIISASRNFKKFAQSSYPILISISFNYTILMRWFHLLPISWRKDLSSSFSISSCSICFWYSSSVESGFFLGLPRCFWTVSCFFCFSYSALPVTLSVPGYNPIPRRFVCAYILLPSFPLPLAVFLSNNVFPYKKPPVAFILRQEVFFLNVCFPGFGSDLRRDIIC